MELALQASDLAALDEAQKEAILQALFIALIADGEPSTQELAQFEQSIASLPWGKDKAQLQSVTRATLAQVQKVGHGGKAAFVKELAAKVPEALREKVVFDMAAIVAADRVASIVERQVVGAFVVSFGLDPAATMEKIKARIPASDVAAEQHVKLEPEDIEALDDTQKLAVLEALVAAVLADGKRAGIGAAAFEHIISKLPWGMERAVLDAQVTGVAQRIASFASPTDVSDFVVRMASRLPSQALREKVFYTVATIVFADGVVSKTEENVLGALVFAFGITSDRLAAIRLAVTGRSPPPASPRRGAS